jgi:hypothetical protein
MSLSKMREDLEPWYKQFWPWFLISLPATAVIASMITIKLAVDTADPLVKDDYYKEGMAINQDISKERLARTLGLSAGFQLDPDTNELRVQLNGSLSDPPPLLLLTLVHPTLGNQDHQLRLLAIGNQEYTTRLPEIPQSNWHLSLTPENQEWKLAGRLELPEAKSGLLDNGVTDSQPSSTGQ